MSEESKQIFSFHLLSLPLTKVPRFLFNPPKDIPGLKHSESFVTMNLGKPILSPSRYKLTIVAFFAWWEDECFLEEFLKLPSFKFFNSGWHVRLKLYRRWGQVKEIKEAFVDSKQATPGQPVVAVTLARLNLRETQRFTKWGKPVEAQVRDHTGQSLALAAIRPLNTFSTFSIWKNEQEMINMVIGKSTTNDGDSHRLAMQERARKDFHHEFTTMRFTPIREVGTWNGKSNYTTL